MVLLLYLLHSHANHKKDTSVLLLDLIVFICNLYNFRITINIKYIKCDILFDGSFIVFTSIV